MTEAVSSQLKLIRVRAPLARALLIVPVALLLAGAWYVGRWCVGDAMAEYTSGMEEGGVDTARAALRLAPDDPLTHWRLADLEIKSLDPGQLREAVRQYEAAVSLSPNDYRLWVDLGRAREQAGDADGGERALRRAVELAPAYSYPRWYLGNLLLREGRIEEAFAELRRAADADPTLHPQIFNLAWHVGNEDVQATMKLVGDSVAERVQLAVYLMGYGRAGDALQLWSALSPAQKREQRAAGETLLNALLAAKRYHAALEIYRDIAAVNAATPAVGQFLNGGFEDDLAMADAGIFGWQVKSVAQARAAVDATIHHSGGRSFRIVFKSPTTLELSNLSQLVVVEPSTAYRLECYVRTADLRSVVTPRIEVVDNVDGSLLGASAPLPPGSSDWQPVAINFKTGAKTEALTARVVRGSCGADPVCPIFGSVWYDDFNLQRAR